MYNFQDTKIEKGVTLHKLYFDLLELDVKRAYFSLYNRFNRIWGWADLPPDSKIQNNIRIGKISKNVYQDDLYRSFLKQYFINFININSINRVYKYNKDSIVIDDVNLKPDHSSIIQLQKKSEYKLIIFLDRNSHLALLNNNTLDIKGSIFEKTPIPTNCFIDILKTIYNNKFYFQGGSFKLRSDTKNKLLKNIQKNINRILYDIDLIELEIIEFFGINIEGSSQKLYYLKDNVEVILNDENLDCGILKQIDRQRYFSKDFIFLLKIILENL